jgi:hypothetical protein
MSDTSGGITMTLAERCDEIVRLIEETLADLGPTVEPDVEPSDGPTRSVRPELAPWSRMTRLRQLPR